MRRRELARLQAYRELYSAVSSLGDSLYEAALAVAEDEREAAFAASCSLVLQLQEHEGEGPPLLRLMARVHTGRRAQAA